MKRLLCIVLIFIFFVTSDAFGQGWGRRVVWQNPQERSYISPQKNVISQTRPQSPTDEKKPQIGGVLIDPSSGKRLHYSERLNCQLVGDVNGAKIFVFSVPSPLLEKLKLGDVITHLDGKHLVIHWRNLPPTISWGELENHIGWTTVDYIDHHTGQLRQTKIYIPNENFRRR